MQISSHDKVYEKLLLIIVGLFLASLELLIPKIPILPWLKPGLINIVTIVWLLKYGYRETLLFGLMRLFLTSFFFGFSFFAACLAIGGMITSVTAMKTVLLFNKRRIFGFVGIGFSGALFHNLGQLTVLSVMLQETAVITTQIPIMVLMSVITGSITGVLASKLIEIDVKNGIISNDEIAIPDISGWKRGISMIFLIAMPMVLLLNTITANLLFLLVILLLSALISMSEIGTTLKRYWLFLLFVPLGFLLSGAELTDSLIHFIRLWAWLQCTTVFRFLQTDRLFFKIVQKLFGKFDTTLAASLLSLEVFPELLKNGLFKTIGHPINLFRSPTKFLENLITMSHTILEEGGWGTTDDI